MKTLYYPARLTAEFNSYLDALVSVGIAPQRAKVIAANAQNEEGDVVVVDIGDGKGIALRRSDWGAVELWQALLGLASESPDEAVADAKMLAASLDDGRRLSQWSLHLHGDSSVKLADAYPPSIAAPAVRGVRKIDVNRNRSPGVTEI